MSQTLKHLASQHHKLSHWLRPRRSLDPLLPTCYRYKQPVATWRNATEIEKNKKIKKSVVIVLQTDSQAAFNLFCSKMLTSRFHRSEPSMTQLCKLVMWNAWECSDVVVRLANVRHFFGRTNCREPPSCLRWNHMVVWCKLLPLLHLVVVVWWWGLGLCLDQHLHCLTMLPTSGLACTMQLPYFAQLKDDNTKQSSFRFQWLLLSVAPDSTWPQFRGIHWRLHSSVVDMTHCSFHTFSALICFFCLFVFSSLWILQQGCEGQA